MTPLKAKKDSIYLLKQSHTDQPLAIALFITCVHVSTKSEGNLKSGPKWPDDDVGVEEG